MVDDGKACLTNGIAGPLMVRSWFILWLVSGFMIDNKDPGRQPTTMGHTHKPSCSRVTRSPKHGHNPHPSIEIIPPPPPPPSPNDYAITVGFLSDCELITPMTSLGNPLELWL